MGSNKRQKKAFFSFNPHLFFHSKCPIYIFVCSFACLLPKHFNNLVHKNTLSLSLLKPSSTLSLSLSYIPLSLILSSSAHTHTQYISLSYIPPLSHTNHLIVHTHTHSLSFLHSSLFLSLYLIISPSYTLNLNIFHTQTHILFFFLVRMVLSKT